MNVLIYQIAFLFLAIMLCILIGYIVFSSVEEEKTEDFLATKERLKKIKNKVYDVPVEKEDNRAKNLIAAILSDEQYRFALLGRSLEKLNLVVKLKMMLKLAGVKTDVSVFLIGIIVACIVLTVVFMTLPPTTSISFILGPSLGIVGPIIYLKIKRGKRLTQFTAQLPDALGLVASSLRAGHSLHTAFAIVVNELSDPIAGIFKITCEDINLGRSTKEAMEDMIHHMPDSLDLRFFVTAVMIQREIGGNLAEILDNLNNTIRERFKLLGQLKSQTAQARLSGIVLALAPAFIGGIIYLLNPAYMGPLFTHQLGKFAICLAVFLGVIGFLIIKKITSIKV